ncbi:MAG: SpoVA/SpoVAEb family sporulation membrane protein [Bacillota bacterium]|nr:SpoVA/SpoVAEb family sporulation membrane protein [Bacillota bacterium]
MNNEQYGGLVDKLSPPSPIWIDIIWAFFVGGAICTLGEALSNLFLYLNLPKLVAASYVSIILIFFAQLFTGMGLFEKLAKRAGAGCSVPITGFANAVVSPAIEYHTEGLVLGIGAKLFTIAGPVIVYGTAASVLAGIIYYIKELFF